MGSKTTCRQMSLCCCRQAFLPFYARLLFLLSNLVGTTLVQQANIKNKIGARHEIQGTFSDTYTLDFDMDYLCKISARRFELLRRFY